MTQVANSDRPDPVSGRQASASYAEGWARSHENVGDPLAYRVGYLDLLVIDKMLSDYTMLDVGCGTGGYLRLAKNYAAVVGLDFSQTMIDQARRLQAELELKNVAYECTKFEDYETDRRFDVVRMASVVGWYRPWPGNEHALVKARKLVRQGGLVVATYVRPSTLWQAGKAMLFPRMMVVIAKTKFIRLVAAAGFEHLFTIDGPHASYAFLRKSG